MNILNVPEKDRQAYIREKAMQKVYNKLHKQLSNKLKKKVR